VGAVAEKNLKAGFAAIGLVYTLGFATAAWPIRGASTAQVEQAD
jgi:hypothetical protein